MKRDLEIAVGTVPADARWRNAPAYAVALVVISILAAYWQTAASIIAIWIRSETFAHGFVVVPICLWLVWRRRSAVAATDVRPWWLGIGLVLLCGAFWLVGSAANALGVQQFALVFMLQAAIVTVIGLRAARVLAFPLAFLLFAVPAGEFMIPTLVDWTADFTVNALRLTGVPVYREANQFIIPSGAWSVVDACSGVRYIIASVMVGTIYSALAYRSARRRALFTAASILVPIVANWLRAYIIVMIGHLSNNRLAAGVDHIIYGWLFFGLVMLLLFWAGSFWQQTEDTATRQTLELRSNFAVVFPAPARHLFAAALAAIAATVIWQPLDAMVRQNTAVGVPTLSVIADANGWRSSVGRIVDWKPRYAGYTSELAQIYSNGEQNVGLYIAYYRNQTKGRELITSTNSLVAPEDWNWKSVASGSDEVNWNGSSVPVDRVELLGRNTRLEVFQLYWVGNRVTASQYVAKALQAWSKLAGNGDDAALIVMYAPVLAGSEDARKSLRKFAAAITPSIERALTDAGHAP